MLRYKLRLEYNISEGNLYVVFQKKKKQKRHVSFPIALPSIMNGFKNFQFKIKYSPSLFLIMVGKKETTGLNWNCLERGGKRQPKTQIGSKLCRNDSPTKNCSIES